MRRSLGVAAARGRRTPRGPRPAHSRPAERHLGQAAQGGDRRRHQAPPRRRSTLAAIATGGNRLAGTRGHELSADYVALQSRLAGLNVSRQDFDYDLYLLGDWKPPVLDVRRGKHYIPGIAGSIPGGDFGSMVNSRLGRRHRARCGRPTSTIPSPAAEHVDSGCEAADFAGMPKGAIVLLQRGDVRRRCDKWLNAQAAGAGAIVFINEGDAGARPDARAGSTWTGAGVDGPDRRRAGRDRARTSPAASRRAWSARPRGCGWSGGSASRPDRERDRRDPRR